MACSEPVDVREQSRGGEGGSEELAATATLTGTVMSTTPFTAAQVHIRNTDKRMTYSVYTNAGQFRAVALFPGDYEVMAEAAQVPV